jgi:hypothetical protein
MLHITAATTAATIAAQQQASHDGDNFAVQFGQLLAATAGFTAAATRYIHQMLAHALLTLLDIVWTSCLYDDNSTQLQAAVISHHLQQ